MSGKHYVYTTNAPGDLAGSEDLEHERQAVRDELLRVLVLLDAAEVLEQALDQRPAVLHEAGAQGLQPGVQRPGNAWESHADSEYTRRSPPGPGLEGATEPTMFPSLGDVSVSGE